MKKNYSMIRNLFLITAVLGTLVCIPYITNMIGIGEPIQLAFIIFALITLVQIKNNKNFRKRGLLLILTSIAVITVFIIAVLVTSTNHVPLTMLNVYTFASSVNSPTKVIVAMLGGVGVITCIIGVILCYLEYFNHKKLS